MSHEITPFESIRRTNPAGNEFWSSRDFAKVLGYVNYRHFQAVIEKARTACSNSGQRVEDHFVGSDQMVEIGSGAQRPLKTVMMSRYACYLVIQNADPSKEIVAQGQTYFAIQTRRQELSDAEIEEQRRLAIRADLRSHNSQLADAAKDAGVIESRDYANCQIIISTQSSTFIDHFSADDIIVVENDNGESTFKRQSSEELSNWLERYTLSQIWSKNLIGGRP